MLGLSQSPILPACAQYSFQALPEALLIALKLRNQPTPFFKLASGRQLSQSLVKAACLAGKFTTVGRQAFYLAALLLLAGTKLAQLPSGPPAYTEACRS